MSILVSCRECEASYKLPDRYAGKRCRCKECKAKIRVPAEEAVEAPKQKRKRKRKPPPNCRETNSQMEETWKRITKNQHTTAARILGITADELAQALALLAESKETTEAGDK